MLTIQIAVFAASGSARRLRRPVRLEYVKRLFRSAIDPEAWATLHSDTSRPFEKPTHGRIAVKVINHLGDEVMKVLGL